LEVSYSLKELKKSRGWRLFGDNPVPSEEKETFEEDKLSGEPLFSVVQNQESLNRIIHRRLEYRIKLMFQRQLVS